MTGDGAIDRGHAFQMTDFVLRAGALPAVHPREQRLGPDAKHRLQGGHRPRHQLAIGLFERAWIARAAEERPQQDSPVRRAMRPLRREP